MARTVFNFAAGPAMLPTEVLENSAKALLDYQGKGVGIAEMSHRGKEFDAVLDETIALCKKLLSVPDTHDILFLQGGATQMFATIPMNFHQGSADFIVGGEWAKKAAGVAKLNYKVNVLASSEGTNFDRIPTDWAPTADASYLYICSNETVHGNRWVEWPKHDNLIVDASSELMARPHPVDRCAMVFGGAQKNLGPAGLTLVIVRKDLYARIPKNLPPIFSFEKHAAAKSCLNTPPSFGVYILLETFRWLDKMGGLAVMEKRNAEKAKLVYDAIDGSNGYYKGTVTNKAQRSHMNVTFKLPNDDVTDKFVKQAAQQGMVALKGYRTVGGIRASIYNAMPPEGCAKLVAFMKEFQASNPAQ